MAAGRFAYYNLIRMLAPASILLVLLVELIAHRLTPGSAGLAYLLSGMPVVVWSFIWVWKRYRPTLTDAPEAMRALLSYGVRAWGADLLGTVANQIDRLLIVGMLAPDSMGLYVVSQAAANLLAAIPQGVVPVLMPKATGLSPEANVALVGRSFRLALVAMLVAALPLVFFGGFLLNFVYGPKFLMANVVLPFLVIETVLDGLTSVLSQAFLAAGQPGLVTMLQGCGLCTAIPLLYWLIPHYGIRGAGIALMLSTTCRFIFVLGSYPLRLKLPFPRFYFTREELHDLGRRFRSQPEGGV